METLNIDRLSERLSADEGISKGQARHILDTTFQTMEEELVAGGRVRVVGFGLFERRVRKGRQARDPQTGELITTPDVNVVKFTPGTRLKKAVKNTD